MKNHLILILFIVGFNFLTAQQLNVFSDIPGRTPSNKYKCRVRKVGDLNWTNSFVLQTFGKANPGGAGDNGYYDNLKNWSSSWTSIEFSGGVVEVEIAKVDGSDIQQAMLRPVGYASPATIVNGKAYFTMTTPKNVNVDIDGQMEGQYTGMGYTGPPIHTISIFGNPIFKAPKSNNSRNIFLNPGETIPNESLWDTISFKPGVHYLTNFATAKYIIKSNKVIHIPGNAVVNGQFQGENLGFGAGATKNWSIYGSGTISAEEIDWQRKVIDGQGQNVNMQGFVIADPSGHSITMNNTDFTSPSKTNIFKHLKVLGWRKNSDAITTFNNSIITDCFFKTQDDHFYFGGRNMRISDNVSWSDANGSTVFVTKSGDANSYFKNIRVIYHRARWHYWEGGRVINLRSREPGNVIKDIYISDIIIEDPFPAFPPFYMEMTNANNSSALYDYQNINFENVRQLHPGVSVPQDANFGKPRNTMLGLDASRPFKNMTFKDCMYNCKMMGSFEEGDFEKNNFTENINFIVTDPCTTEIEADPIVTENNWTYYGVPCTGKPLFAIEHKPVGGNTNDFTAKLSLKKICVNPTVHQMVNSTEKDGIFVAGNYWNINLTNGSTNGFVNMRFFPDSTLNNDLDNISNGFYASTAALYQSPSIYFKTNNPLALPLDIRSDGKGLNYGFNPLLINSTGTYSSKNYVQFNNVLNIHNSGGGLIKQITNRKQNSTSGIPKGSLRYNSTNDKFEGFDGTDWIPLH